MAKSEHSKNKVRIIGGSHRSRQVKFPERPGLRPTGDRVRETLFNWLQLDVAGARCLDLFAGSGILGIEALSRGASWVDFIDSDRLACSGIRDNLSDLDMTNAAVKCVDALACLREGSGSNTYDIIFLDPPFAASNTLPTILQLMEKAALSANAKIYLESGSELIDLYLGETWKLIKSKTSGQVSYGILQRLIPNS